VVLLAAAIVAVYLAVHFFAVARGSSFAPFKTWTHGDRFAVMLAVLVVLVGLLVVLLRRAGRPVWLAAEHGGVLVTVDTIAEPLQRELLLNVEVVGAQVHVSSRRGRLRADVQVAVRPLADAETLRAEFAATVGTLLRRMVGVDPDYANVEPDRAHVEPDCAGVGPDCVHVKVHVLSARQLGRHL